MTYAMYARANRDPLALLNAGTLADLASETFSVFFQHFASNNVSLDTGSWVYQPINASLPPDVGPGTPKQNKTSYQNVPHPVSQTNRTVEAKVSTRIVVLEMSVVAVWLSVSILIWLMFTTVAVIVLQRRQLRKLIRDIDCVGDVLVLVVKSKRLLHMAREMKEGRQREDDDSLKTKLGWFEDEDRKMRWGIELVDERTAFRVGA